MGRLQAEELAANLPTEQALGLHLQCNHYPPVNSVFIPVARDAIDRANREDYDTVLKMPNGKSLSVSQIIEGLHLDCFLDQEDC